MEYVKINTTIKPYDEWLTDILIDQYAQIGFESFEKLENGFNGYIHENLFNEENLNSIVESFDKYSISYQKEIIKSQNWNKKWEENYFKPLKISDECVIRAPFHQEFPNAKFEIIIEPNMAFGTGNHETTSLMIREILKNDLTEKTILDMGCGTGILSILSSMKGAKTITAIDIDEWAYKAIIENSKINHIENIQVIQGDASHLSDKSYDFIYANIHKNVIINDLSTYEQCLKNNGIILLSGFYQKDLENIKRHANQLKLKLNYYNVENNWIVAVFSK